MAKTIYQYTLPVVMTMVGWISLALVYGLIINIGIYFNPPFFLDFFLSTASFIIYIAIFVAGVLFAKLYIAKREQYGKMFHILAIVELGGLFGVMVAQTIVDYQTIHVIVIPLLTIFIFLLLYKKCKT